MVLWLFTQLSAVVPSSFSRRASDQAMHSPKPTNLNQCIWSIWADCFMLAFAQLMCPTKVVRRGCRGRCARHIAPTNGRFAAQWYTRLHGPPVSQLVPQQLLEQCPNLSRYAVPQSMPRSVPQILPHSALQSESIWSAIRLKCLHRHSRPCHNFVIDAIDEGAQNGMSA